jgi:hypothetical protein
MELLTTHSARDLAVTQREDRNDLVLGKQPALSRSQWSGAEIQ